MKTLTKTFARRVISALLVTIMVFSLGITSIVSTSAAEVELAETGYDHSGGYLYFYNTNSWSNVSILIGPANTSTMYTFDKLSGNLYYLDMPSFSQWHNWVILDAAGWGYSSTQGVYDRSESITGKIAYQESYSFNDGSTYFITPTNNSNSWYKSGGYSALNYTQKAICQVSTDNGSTYTDSSAGGSVTVSTYKLTGNGTGSTASETGSRASAVGTQVTMTATVNEGYTFAGWYSGTTKVDSDTTYTYTNSGSTKTVYAKFKSNLEVSLADGQATELTATVGDNVTINATATGSSSYTYTLVDGTGEAIDGIPTNSTGSFTVPCNAPGTYIYKVQASNGTTTKVTDGTVTVTVTDYDFQIDAEAPKSVMTYKDIVITPSSNAPENATVTYTLKDGDTEIPYSDGKFTYTTVADDSDTTKKFTLTATTTIGTTEYTNSIDIPVEVTPFDLSVTLTAPESIEGGLRFDLIAGAYVPQGVEVEYTFSNKTTGDILTTVKTGTYTVTTTSSDAGNTYTYAVTATATVNGQTYTSTAEKSVEITGVTEFFNVVICFKGSGTLGYRPLITTTGAVNELNAASMERDVYIRTNESQTAHYYWFKSEIQVSKAKPTVQINVMSERYDFEGEIDLDITSEGQVFYLAVDNLFNGLDMVDLTGLTFAERTWCKNALHMVYDEALDGTAALAEVDTYALTSIGDANGDGNINIQDATYIQKSLANMVTLDDTATVVSDVTDDGDVTISDATALQKQLAGL